MFNILNNTNVVKFLPFPPSIIIGIRRPFFTVFLFPAFSPLILLAHATIYLHGLLPTSLFWPVFFPHYFLGGVIVPYFLTPPLATLLIYALPLHSVFWHLHCFAVSSPYCTCFLLELSSECLLHHASKCSPYPVQSLCIHWLHIVHPIILSVHNRTSNLGFYIFQNVVHAYVPLTV